MAWEIETLKVLSSNTNLGKISASGLDCKYSMTSDIWISVVVSGASISGEGKVTAIPYDNATFSHWGNKDNTIIYPDGNIADLLNNNGNRETSIYAYFTKISDKQVYTKDVVDLLLYDKVDKLEGRELSENNFTNELKDKLEQSFNDKHIHSNKDLLDEYTQTNEQLSSAVSNKHSHSNKDILDNTTASYSVEEQDKLAGLSNYDDSSLQKAVASNSTNITSLQNNYDAIDSKINLINSKIPSSASTTNNLVDKSSMDTASQNTLNSAKTYAENLVNNLVGGADEAFDTLKEIADWIANDEQGTSALVNRVSACETDIDNLENGKVDKVSGKGLSANDLTNTLKSNYDIAYRHSHSHSNKPLLDTYTQTETDLADAVTKKHTHSNKTILDNTTASYTTAEKTKLEGLSNYDDTSLQNAITNLENNKANIESYVYNSNDGYVKFTSGILICWGRAYTGLTTMFQHPFTFKHPFDGHPYIVMTAMSPNKNGISMSTSNRSNTGFEADAYGVVTADKLDGIAYIAIGIAPK